MIGAQANMMGTRLSYVVVEQEGTVRRNVHKFKKGQGVTVTTVEQPAGYLVYFPRGHVIHIASRAELRHYKLHKEPRLVSLQGLNDPNSAIGKLMFAQDEASRRGAMADLEKLVIQMAEAKSGKIELTRDVNDLVSAEDEMEDA